MKAMKHPLGTIASFPVITALSAALVAPAHSASVFFTPAGTQLDQDLPPDLALNTGEIIDFTFFLDTTGLPADLLSIDLLVGQDTGELDGISIGRTPEDIATFPNFSILPATGDIPSGIFRRSNPAGVPIGTLIPLVEGTFFTPILINDGQADFLVEVVSAFDVNGNDITGFFTPVSQSIDVQSTPETSPGLSLLALGLLGTGINFIRQKNH